MQVRDLAMRPATTNGFPAVRASRRRSGFTLLEVVLALIILSIGIVSIFSLFGVAAASHSRAMDHDRAARMAMMVMVDVRQSFDEQTPENIAGAKHPSFPGSYTYDVEHTALDADGNEFLVVVTVKWNRGGRGFSEKFETVMVRRLK
jgi:prepilin-type N-terminal cleavage/methylation domain-containing protein